MVLDEESQPKEASATRAIAMAASFERVRLKILQAMNICTGIEIAT
jgi:hypothetical protein